MMRRAAALLLLATCQTAVATEYVSVAEPAILYDANSLKANKLFVATRYLPLEQMVVLENWVKVRDSNGKIFWIEKRFLSGKRYVVVTATSTAVRSNWDNSAPVVFVAPRQLGLEWLGNQGALWVKVRHRDGETGFVKSSDVWGE
ncbi:MAG: SH3 domain-containing protein [Sideroxydans sp.]|nr:SH3 domain-containing protein [Sideroxydans sp.]